MKIHYLWGKLTDISIEKEPLLLVVHKRVALCMVAVNKPAELLVISPQFLYFDCMYEYFQDQALKLHSLYGSSDFVLKIKLNVFWIL